MKKKTWVLLIATCLLVYGWYKLFYKTWSNEGVAKDADCVLAVDTKRVANTLIWQFITTPSQWKNISFFSADDGRVKWSDMVKLPDYVFIFHKPGQPANALYTVAEINNREDFEKGLQQFHFEKTGEGHYSSKETGIELIQSGMKLLIGNTGVEDKKLIIKTAAELFNKKEYAPKDLLQGNVSTNKHFSLQLINSVFGKHQIITGGFDKQTAFIDASFTLPQGVSFMENNFSYSDTSFATLCFSQPLPSIKNLLGDSARAAVSRALNFNIDSVLLPANQYCQLDIEGFHARVDSAISYVYDDNFNAVKNVVINNVDEPAFNFIIRGQKPHSIYNYLERNGKIEKNEKGDWFTPVPFVKSYCSVKNENEFRVVSGNYKTTLKERPVECIFFLKLMFSKNPLPLQEYIPPAIAKALANIESVEAKAINEKGKAMLHVSFNKKKNGLPLFGF